MKKIIENLIDLVGLKYNKSERNKSVVNVNNYYINSRDGGMTNFNQITNPKIESSKVKKVDPILKTLRLRHSGKPVSRRAHPESSNRKSDSGQVRMTGFGMTSRAS